MMTLKQEVLMQAIIRLVAVPVGIAAGIAVTLLPWRMDEDDGEPYDERRE